MVSAETAGPLAEVFSILQSRSSHDFSRYKHSTVMRRLQRRMQVTNSRTLGDYVAKLHCDPGESGNLFKDLLIGVTQFFRDSDSFEVLQKKVLRPLLFGRDGTNTVRIWVPGCATGEEAYSIAILIRELMVELEPRPPVQIFATDLDEDSLEHARKAYYAADIVQEVSASRLDQFFRPIAGGFELIQEVREMCLFSLHNVIQDPPFSRLDLISCRNLLIYLESDIQKKLLPVFHYALNPSGHLFLGPSENVAARCEHFRVIDQKHRIFQRRPIAISRQPAFALNDGGRYTRVYVPSTLSSGRDGNSREAAAREPVLTRTIERILIEEYSAPSVIINHEGDVVYFSGKAEKYLRPPAGSPTNKLVALVRKPLRLELRMAVQQAIATKQRVTRDRLAIKLGETVQPLRLVIRPLPELGKDCEFFIVIFEELAPTSNAAHVLHGESSQMDESILRQLEDELRTTKEDLQTTIEELETSNEELKSANEELLSMNEELQSANEELQTSKEEIQSINDELQRKIEEVDAANDQLNRTLERISDAFVAMDPRWRYTFANKQAREILFKLKPGEEIIGRSVWELFPDLVGTDIYNQLHRAMDLQTTVSFELRYAKMWFACTIYPSTDGLSIYFQEVSQRKLEEQRAKEQSALDAISGEIGRHVTESNSIADCLQQCVQSLVKHLDAAFARIWLLNSDRTVLELHASAGIYTHLNGAHARIPIGKFKIGLIAAERKPHLTNNVIGDPRIPEQEWAKSEGMTSFAGHPIIVGDDLIGVLAIFARQQLSSQTLEKLGVVASMIGIAVERLRAAQKVQRSEDRFRSLVHASAQIVWSINPTGEIVEDSPSWQSFTGQTFDQLREHGWIEAIHPDDRELARSSWLTTLRDRTVHHGEYRMRRADGIYRWMEVRAVPILNGDGTIREWVGASTDITEKKEIEQLLEGTVAERTASLQETIGELEAFSYSVSHDLRSPLRAMQGYALALLEDCGEQLSSEHKSFLERIARSAGRLDRLTLDVLAYSRLSRTEFQPKPIHLEKVLADVLDQYPQFAPFRSNIQIIPPFYSVQGHEAFLAQCISNLLGNAVKFVNKDKAPEIKVWTEAINDDVRLWVEDNGIGIAAEHRDRIFQMFGRVHHEHEYEGTGIGLALVKKAVERMGGSIGYESTLGKGSRFWIQLPKA